MIKAWIKAARPRTLPLSLSCIGMGAFLAAYRGSFDGLIFTFCILTTIFLQVLSNLSNDYGDSIHGADSENREGPSRAVQSGEISAGAMKNAMVVFAMLALVSGLLLLWFALGSSSLFWVFLGLGIAAIAAAITYTSGKKPYGYAGLGDISVLIFFGFIGVMGTYFLFTKSFEWINILPALSCGLFSVAVLNVNNLRDIESDREAGKKSIPVRIGREMAMVYHWFLLTAGFSSAVAFTLIEFATYYQFLFVISLPLLLANGRAVTNKHQPSELDPYLKHMALTTLLFVLTFGIGMLL
ncbi:MAG: 1,4-dihydroxy-2-naphthoate polyprenyltransferase [Bacteroidetes bacterium]|nr:1,4-dihydroxy-2-naphthoate polyprenyltransferase [Bacteroidota bacterium]MDA1121565.1 1,4-dihydroxy-2-naphthoate polyprenyltransferase [Bacteroidota bacterium]